MSTSTRGTGDIPSERTPLLTHQTPDQASVESAVVYNDASIVAEDDLGTSGPGDLSGFGNRRASFKSYISDVEEETGIAEFGDDGRLKGISKTQFRFIFGGVLLGYFAATFDSTLMFSSHPVITSHFNASNSASWLSTSFLLTSTSLQPLFGRVSDTIGRRSLYLAGLLILSATTAWCALAQSIGSFIAARAFCGIGAAGVMSMGGIMTNDLVSIRVRGKYQAYINLFYGGGSACGAAFGGFLCDRIGWRMTFAIQVPVIFALFINAIFTTPSDIGPQLAKRSGKGIMDAIKGFDLAGSALLTTSVAFLILGLNLGGNVYPWKHPLVIASLVIALVGGSILIRVEQKAARPVMPLGMLSSQPRGNLVFNNFFAQIGINTIFFNIPLYFQAVKLETPSMSGFRLAAASIALTMCGVSAGFIMTATGRMKWLIVVGSLFLLTGGICLSSLWNGIPPWLATVFIVPAAIGQGLSFPATSLAVLATSSQEDQAVMQSTLNLWRSLGTVMGVSFSSLILQNALTAYLNSLVTGKHKELIILTVRRSVRSIIDLDQKHQGQVIDAYNRSLKVTFLSAIVMFVITNILVFHIGLPNIRRKEEVQGEDQENGVRDGVDRVDA